MRSDEGSAFVWIIALCGVCVIAALAVVQLGRSTYLQALAQNAADAAALSGAYEVSHFRNERACQAANGAAQRNGAIMTSCEVTQDDVVVSIQMNADTHFRAHARAEIE